MAVHQNSDFANLTDNLTRHTAQRVLPLLASYGLPVAGAYRIEWHSLDHQKVRVVVAAWNLSGKSDCWPVLEPHLAEDFAGITAEGALRDFNEHYGLLGYHLLHQADMQRRNETWQGDPVDWALAHARIAAGILGATGIINDVRSGKEELNDRSVGYLLRALLSEFEKMGLESMFAAGPPRRWEGFTWTTPEALASRSKFQLRKRFSARWGNDPIGTAYHVLSWVLNQYIRSVRFEFVSIGYAARFFELTESEPHFGPELRWDALLQVIYWQLAERLGGAFRKCRGCGRVFAVDEPKQIFHSTKCGDAFHSREHRKRKKEKGLRTKEKRMRLK
jgi:hypothetical protein